MEKTCVPSIEGGGDSALICGGWGTFGFFDEEEAEGELQGGKRGTCKYKDDRWISIKENVKWKWEP